MRTVVTPATPDTPVQLHPLETPVQARHTRLKDGTIEGDVGRRNVARWAEEVVGHLKTTYSSRVLVAVVSRVLSEIATPDTTENDLSTRGWRKPRKL